MTDSPEKRIQEQRTIEATKNNLMGFGGKLGCIAKNLGEPIIAEYFGGKYFSSNSIPDYMNLDSDEDEMRTVQIRVDGEAVTEPGDVDPTWSRKFNQEDATIEQIGWYFDGLNRGIHLEIKCFLEEGRITVYFKGYNVYTEIAGELLNYNPNGGWEKQVDKLFETAQTKERSQKKIDKQKSQEEIIKNKTSWLQKIRDKWGV